jgi:hypothetical protein
MIKRKGTMHDPYSADEKAAIVDRICERISHGESFYKISQEKDWCISRVVFHEWIEADQKLANKYAKAINSRTEKMADELLEIADDGKNDWMASNDPNNPGYKHNGEHSQRSRLRLDTRKWLMSKMLPKKYGDRVEHSIGGSDSLPPITSADLRNLSPEDAAKKYAELIKRGS